jgi:diacylglycerol O-acyltransferase / wax synthase
VDRQQMSPADAAWLHMGRPTNLMVVNGVMWFDRPVDYERLKETIRERLIGRFPRFHQRVVEPALGVGRPAWEDDAKFDLDLHLHRRALPAPGDASALGQLASELAVMPLDPAKPLWDMYLVEGYGSGAALITRMHHCIADGIALARVLLSLTDEKPGSGLAPPAEIQAHRVPTELAVGAAHLLDAALHEGLEMLTHPAAETRAVLDGVTANARALAKLLLTGPDARTVLKQPPGIARRLTWCEPVSLEEIKAIGHASGTTLNDVVVTAIAGALRSYLAQRGSLVAEIRAVVPFNLRPPGQPLPRELGNWFGLVELPLPIAVADPGERLAEVHRRMESIKHSAEGSLSYRLLGLVGLAPPVLERRIVDLMSEVETVVITNVPGPSGPVYLAGARVTGMLAWVPTGGSIGIGVSVVSYDGAVTVGLQTAVNVVPDPERVVSAFAGEMRELTRLRAGSRRRRGRQTQAGARRETPAKRSA